MFHHVMKTSDFSGCECDMIIDGQSRHFIILWFLLMLAACLRGRQNSDCQLVHRGANTSKNIPINLRWTYTDAKQQRMHVQTKMSHIISVQRQRAQFFTLTLC